jgi:hypothetical protein
MIKTSRSVQSVFVAATLASTFACSGKSGPAPLGTGGSDAAVGGSGSGAGGAASTFTNPIPFHGAWTPGAENTAGIQGAFYILEDLIKDNAPLADGLTHSNLWEKGFPDGLTDFSKFNDMTPLPCIEGDVAVVADPANPSSPPYDAIWGGGIGMNLNEEGGEGSSPMPFDASAKGITGFEFKMSGDAQSATLRFKATQAGLTDDFCYKISPVPGQAVKVRFSELKHSCWEPDDVALDVTKLEAIQWQIVTDVTSPHKVTNFCITELGYLTD